MEDYLHPGGKREDCISDVFLFGDWVQICFFRTSSGIIVNPAPGPVASWTNDTKALLNGILFSVTKLVILVYAIFCFKGRKKTKEIHDGKCPLSRDAKRSSFGASPNNLLSIYKEDVQMFKRTTRIAFFKLSFSIHSHICSNDDYKHFSITTVLSQDVNICPSSSSWKGLIMSKKIIIFSLLLCSEHFRKSIFFKFFCSFLQTVVSTCSRNPGQT